MAVILEGSIRRYVASSADIKPMSTDSDTIPAGSSILESDTGKLYRWNGHAWQVAVQGDEVNQWLSAILAELVQLRTLAEMEASQ